MPRLLLIALSACLLTSAACFAQTITFPAYHKEDGKDIAFEILGKVGKNYMVYKHLRSWKHVLQIFDLNMKEISNETMDYISEKTKNADFITYPDKFNMIYQYQKNGTLYCNAVMVDAEGKKIAGPVTLDTTRTGMNNDIYFTTYSEDKTKILVYKVQERYSKITVVTKLYDQNFLLLDSTRRMFAYDDRREVYTDYQVDNDGNIVYAKEMKNGFRDNIDQLEIITHAPRDSFATTAIPLYKTYIDELKIKIDNLNKTYLLNSFYYKDKMGTVLGLMAAVVKQKPVAVKVAFNPFADSLRNIIKTGEYRFAFNDFYLKNIFVKKDGSYIIAAEDKGTISRTSNLPYSRRDYLFNNAYTPGDYYYGSSSYYPYYRNDRYNVNTRYFYNNILIAGIDSNLNLKWNNIILKNQAEDNMDDFLSYGVLNTGSEIHFLFIDKEKNSQIISNHSLYANGQVYRNPTVKSREAGYDFMPRHARQVGVRQVIVPSIYRGYLVFAKIDF